MRAKRLGQSLLACCIVAGLGLPPATAKDVKITKNSNNEDIAWTVRFDEVQNGNTVDLAFDATTFILTKTVTFNNNTPVSVLFFEDAVATVDSENSGGMRIFMNATLTNKSPLDWRGFAEQLLDTTPVCDGGQDPQANACKVTTAGRNPATRQIGTGAHPQFSHFHIVAATKLGPFTDATAGGANTKRMLTVTGGPVKINDAWKPEKIVLHDVEVQGFRRQFVLTEVPLPVPEPGTWLMLAGGLVAVGEWVRRRRPTAS